MSIVENKQEVTRTKLHERAILCEGYKRSDGLFDVEATLTDTKTLSFFNHERGEIEAGEPIHKMILIVTFSLDMEIRNIQSSMPWTPFKVCPKAMEKMKLLVGIKVGPGWMKEVKSRVPSTDSCTHLVELLGPICTTAYQTMHFAIEQRENAKPVRNAPPILDQCHALQSSSEQVKVMWPEFYTSQKFPKQS